MNKKADEMRQAFLNEEDGWDVDVTKSRDELKSALSDYNNGKVANADQTRPTKGIAPKQDLGIRPKQDSGIEVQAQQNRTPSSRVRSRKNLHPDWRETYILALSKKGTCIGACKMLGISRTVVSELRQSDPSFVTEEEEARKEFAETLEQAGFDRALSGDPGADKMLQFMIQGNIPRYKDSSHVTVNAGQQIIVDLVKPRGRDTGADVVIEDSESDPNALP